MSEFKSKPYLLATLSAPQTSLDLSGTPPFNFRITATLHAQNPILCYIADTFLYPQTAHCARGIEATKLDSHPQPIQRSTVSINTGHSTSRPWDADHCILFQPLEPVCIDMPFGALRGGAGDFDVRLWITTAGFETGGSYEAVLPAGGVISWWRWASPDDELVKPGQRASNDSVAGSSIGENDMDDGVPILPEEEQLKIHTSGDKVIFTCIGQPVRPKSQQI
jgi:hypothetical protein